MPEPVHATQNRSDSEHDQFRAEVVVSASLSIAVTLFTAIVLARGAGLHLEQSLGGLATFFVYLALSTIAVGAVWMGNRAKAPLPTFDSRTFPLGAVFVATVCPLLSTLILGRDLSAGMLVLFCFLTFVTAGGCLWLSYRALATNQRQQSKSTLTSQSPEVSTDPPSRDTNAEAALVSPSYDAPEEETFSQRWTRRDGEIGDELEGTLHIYFAAGQRIATADIPIVPAMSRIPDVDCEPVSGDADVQVIVRSVHTYGVRLELQRSADCAEAEEVEVAVLIHAERSGNGDAVK